MSNLKMTAKEFRKVTKRDFDNGAVRDEITNALTDREKLLIENTRLQQPALPNPLQIELGEGKVLVAKFQDDDGAVGVMFACGHGQFPIGTPFGNLEGYHAPQAGEVYIRCKNLASLKVLKDAVLEAEQALRT
ncbi:MAG TPA: hypothetical protein ENI27_03040 [bacterium]|nr:hypothetical protein [bacterium]